MNEFWKKFSLIPKGLKYKLIISFALMTILPLIACLYMVWFLLPDIFLHPPAEFGGASLMFLASLLVALTGFVLAKKVIEPIIDMALETKIIVAGNYDHRLKVEAEDELGDLGASINHLTSKIKENMDELKTYGERTRQVNMEIHKKVMALSNLLQIGDTIAAKAELNVVLELVLEKVVQMMEVNYALFLAVDEKEEVLKPKKWYGRELGLQKALMVKPGAGFLGEIAGGDKMFVLDSRLRATARIENFRSESGITNAVIMPIYGRNKLVGMLLACVDKEGFKFKEDDLELVRIFSKQVAIALENDQLSKKAKALAIKDDLTDLYNERYIKNHLDEEIRRAILYQRPCSFVLFNIDDFIKFRDTHNELVTESVLKKIASILKENLTEIGKAARLSGDEFAMLLPEKNKKAAIDIAEEVRHKIEKASLKDVGKIGLTVSGGVSENPIDGITSDELFKKAKTAVREAKAGGKNKIVA